MADIEMYSRGLCYCSVCAAADVPIEDIEAYVNLELPTGIKSLWKLSDDPTFANGQPNPSPCERGRGRKHYLLSC